MKTLESQELRIQALEDQNQKLLQKNADLLKNQEPSLQTEHNSTPNVLKPASRKKMSVFFSRIASFTKLSETLEPESLTWVLNDYFAHLAEVAQKHGGTIDRFAGDSTLIFFGDDPQSSIGESALACVDMALEMCEQMPMLREYWASHGVSEPIRIRVGITTGYCTVGNFGFQNLMKYTIIGREVNLARKLEAFSEADHILISNETYALVREVMECERTSKVPIEGIAHPVQSFKVNGRRKHTIEESLSTSQNKIDLNRPGISMTLNIDEVVFEDKEALLEFIDSLLANVQLLSE